MGNLSRDVRILESIVGSCHVMGGSLESIEGNLSCDVRIIGEHCGKSVT